MAMSSEEQVVVESPTDNEAPVGSLDVSPAADRVVQLLPLESQVSLVSSVQLSPNRVQDVFPVLPWMCFRYFRCPRKPMDIFPIRSRLRHRTLGAYRVHRSHRLPVLC